MSLHIQRDEVIERLRKILHETRPCSYDHDQHEITQMWTDCFTMMHPNGFHTTDEDREGIDFGELSAMMLHLYTIMNKALEKRTELRGEVSRFLYETKDSAQVAPPTYVANHNESSDEVHTDSN